MVDYFIYDLATNAEFTEFVTGYRNRIEIAKIITLSNLVPNTTYYFRIAYIKDGIKTPYSNAVLTTDAIPTTTTTTATSITPTGFRANFNSVADADSYEVDLLNSSNVVLDTVTTTNNYYDFTDLSNLTLYKYRVRVVIEGYESTNSNLTEITTLSGIPATPTNLVTSSITSTGFTAAWDLVSGATSYDISINDGTAINVLTNTYNATALPSGTTNTWKVRARNASGASAYTTNQSVLLIPAVPSSLSTTSITSTGFTANWGVVTGASSYDVSINDGVAINTGLNNYVVTGLSSGVTHTWKARAKNASGNSNYTANQSVLTIPATPTGLAVSTFTNTTATIIWNSSTGASSYKLYIKLAGTPIAGYNGKVIAGTTESVTGLTEGTTYTIEVLATNASGDSALSGSINLITSAFRVFYRKNNGTRNYIYSNNETFTNEVKLTSQNSFAELDFTISKNQNKAIFNRDIYANGNYQLFLYDVETKTETQLTANSTINYRYPCLNADGTQCFYTIGSSDIFKNVTTGSTGTFVSTQLKLNNSTSDATGVSNLYYNNTANRVYFTTVNVMAYVNNTLSTPTRIFDTLYPRRHPHINKAESQIAFCWSGTSPIGAQAWLNCSVANLNGTSPTRISAHLQEINSATSGGYGAASFRPVYDSTDTKIFYFLAGSGASNRLMRIDSNGSNNIEVRNGTAFTFSNDFALMDSGVIIV